MGRLPSASLLTLWILFFSLTTTEDVAAGHTEEFACFTDYDKELVCHWKVPAQTNCTKEFLLYYRKKTSFSLNDECVPENGKDTSKCTCTISPDYFVSGLTYILALQVNGTDLWNYSITPALVVKPRAPRNLAIKKTANGNFNLIWEESYSPLSMLSGQPVIYEVKYWRKQHPAEVSVKAINYQAKSFEITASSLRRGYDYVASVRCNYTDYPAYWSEWSEEVEFHSDYQVTAEDILQMAVPVSCILIMAVSVICYFCFTKVKKEWWDQIPDPAKSHLVVKNVKFSVLCYVNEIKFPFHDLKHSCMENQISCTKCLAQSLSSQSFKGKDNIKNVEKSCSCHSKPGEWFPKGTSADLIPETVLVEKSIEICECLTDVKADTQEETTSDHITMFEPFECNAFKDHTEHNDALASMFIELLADEDNVQDSGDPDILIDVNRNFGKLESVNPSLRSPREGVAQSQWPCDTSHTVSLFTKASQNEYNCSTASKKSGQSEESFESGYHSSSINSASLDARDLQHTVHQSLFLCSSDSQHDACVLIQESPNKPSFGTSKDRISNPTQRSFDILMSPPMEPCSSACKSCDILVSPSMEPSGSAYKSFDTLVSAFKEPSSSAYKSFDASISQSMAKSNLPLCYKNMCSAPPLTEFSETPELSCREKIYQLPSNQSCYTKYRSPCNELDFQNSHSEHTDLPPFSTRANDSALAFLPEEEIHKQITYQNVQKRDSIISFPIGLQPFGYQPFNNSVKCNGTYCDNDSEFVCKSLYEPFIHLLYNNPRETPPETIVCDPDQRTDDNVGLIVQGLDWSIVPGLTSSENVTQTSDGSLCILNSKELSCDSKHENTSRDEQLLHLSELNCQGFNVRERTAMGMKPNRFNYDGEGMQGSSSNRPNTDFQCHMHN
ncbi:interleukin-4 receptor subunit alpha [Calypte anna]|nr:interleukin-4 receptor subunit alpha [Calypte anna]XP_030315463.1 interleukin-4 receptor subunit alpha [Calypte anna]